MTSLFRRRPERFGQNTIIHLRRFNIDGSFEDAWRNGPADQALVVGPGLKVSRMYLEHLQRQGFEGIEDIPEGSIVIP